MLPRIAAHVERCAAQAGGTAFDAYLAAHRDFLLTTIQRTRAALQAEEYDRLPRQVIHCDYHPGNLKFQDGRVTGLFDLDWSKVDVRCFDVALALTYFCTAWAEGQDGVLQLDKADAFLSAYQQALQGARRARPLRRVEWAYLLHLARAGHLYVLHWTLTDFYRRAADPGEYLVYLRHGVRALRQLAARPALLLGPKSNLTSIYR